MMNGRCSVPMAAAMPSRAARNLQESRRSARRFPSGFRQASTFGWLA
jgi:hypothetical protein